MPLLEKQCSPVELSRGIAEARYFCLTEGRPTDEFLYLGGYERCEENYSLERASFPFLTLEIVLSGEGHLVLGEYEKTLRPGTCFCFGPGFHHRIVAKSSIPMEKFFIVFGRNALPRRNHPKALYPGCCYEGVRAGELRKWTNLILEEGFSQLSAAAANVAALLEILVRKIGQEDPEAAPPTAADALAYKALRRIDRDFRSLRSAQELAEGLGVTPEHLCRVFRKSQHASPYRVLISYKMAHAYTLLKLSSLSVQEVADAIGFSDAFHFSRAFKKHYGKSPSQAR